MKRILWLFIFMLLTMVQLYAANFSTIVEPKKPFSNRWCFLVDTSTSTENLFDISHQAFMETVKDPTDDLRYCVITFNDESNEEFRDWVACSKDELGKTKIWIEKHRGVLTYVKPALKKALELEEKALTIVFITDGGFTESSHGAGFDEVRKHIDSLQEARVKKGLPKAIIATIGLYNPDYTAGGKPSDEDCQAYLKELGTKYDGGYYLIKRDKKK